MSYPGQPGPYGQQPDPYWQQGGPPGWGPPPPPRKSSAGLWTGLTIAVVLVAALGVTGFAWPGFFLASDDKPASSGSDDKSGKGGNCAEPADKEDPEPVAKALVACISAKNKDVLEKFACEDASKEVTRAVDTVERVDRAKLVETVKVSDDEARAVMEITIGGKTESLQAVLANSDETWCWKRMDSGGASRPTTSARGKPSGRPSSRQSGSPESKIGPPSGEGGELLTKFVEALNKKDASAANDLVCEGAKLIDGVDDVIGRNPELTIEDDVTETESWINARLDGTLDGQISGGVLSADKKDGRWCISDLLVF